MEESINAFKTGIGLDEKNILSIRQEAIAFLHFPKQEVLRLRQEIKNRAQAITQLMNAVNMGMIQVCVYFEDIAGPKKVNAHFAGVEGGHVILYPSTPIPLHRINQIECLTTIR